MEKTKQKRLKGLTKAIYVITKIARIFCIIGIVGIGLGLITIPLVASKVRIEDSKIKFEDKVYSYEVNNNKLTFYEGEKKLSTVDVPSNIKDIDEFFSKITSTELVVMLESVLAFAAIIVVLTIMLLKKIEEICKNIHDKDTPFIMENVELIRKCIYLLAISLGVSILADIIFGIAFKYGFSINISFSNIVFILGAIVMMYIFEYGCNLQEKSDDRIYGEINE